MAKYLMHWMLCVLVIGTTTLSAETLRDPTMPASQSGLVPLSQLPEVAPPPMLQSITLGTNAKSAMINGKTVMLGQPYEQWVLVKLTANEAVLRAKDGSTKVLVMSYPFKKTGQTHSSPTKPLPTSGQSIPSNANHNQSTEGLRAQALIQAESPWVKQ